MFSRNPVGDVGSGRVARSFGSGSSGRGRESQSIITVGPSPDGVSRRPSGGEAHATWLQLQLASASADSEKMELVVRQLEAAERADRDWSGLDLWRAAIALRMRDRPDYTWSVNVLRRSAVADARDARPRLGLLQVWMDEIALAGTELDATHPGDPRSSAWR